MGIGVVDFTNSVLAPKIWLQHEDDSWRIASTGKISILLAAVQLRDDVRWVKETKILSTPEEYDELFAMPQLWKTAPVKTRQIIGKAHAPRISTIFDFTKDPVDFLGPKIDKTNFKNIMDTLAASGLDHLTWPLATDFDFSERLWLAGAESDDVAATTCISEIGVAYIKAVQRAYGLFDESHGMHLLQAGWYSDFKAGVPVSNRSDVVVFRPLPWRDVERNHVKDAMLSASRRFDDQSSWEPGSAAALVAYMIALMQNRLVSLRQGDGKEACETIRDNLSSGDPMTISYVAEGVKSVTEVKKEITKIGLLTTDDGEPGPLNCEFAYLETQEKDVGKRKMQYGVVATGIRSGGSAGPDAFDLSETLGKLVHKALLAP